MKIAIISDIHGNIFAFKEVVEQMKSQKMDMVFSLGDDLGYCHYANEVFSEIKKWDNHKIAGNHERIFLKFIEGTQEYKKEITDKYGYCYLDYEKRFVEEVIESIKMLSSEKSVVIDGCRFLLCHGSPLDKDHYLYPDADNQTLLDCDSIDQDFVFTGHTHYPMIYVGEHSTIINVQLRLTKKGPVVFEINPRFSSTVLFRHMFGFQDLIWSVQDILNQQVSTYVKVKTGRKFYKGFSEYID